MLNRKIKGGLALLTLTAGTLTFPATHSVNTTGQPQEIYALQSVYGFGNGTAIFLGITSTVICGTLTAGVGGIACGIGSAL